MLSLSRLLNGTLSPGDALRYGRPTPQGPPHLLHFAREKKPVVVWNVTRRCNLFCRHCYADSHDRAYPGELSTQEGKALLEDLAAYGTPVILFSGGEPLLRPDLLELAAHAKAQGLRCVLSSNGTLLTEATAERLRQVGFDYVGISLDGIGRVHDKIRGKRGAYEAALAAVRLCRAAGLKVGLRFTLQRDNAAQLPQLFDLLVAEGVPRFCLYHLAYAGRGARTIAYDLPPQDTRRILDELMERVRELYRQGVETEVLTVDNHSDAVYLYLRLRQEAPARAQDVHQLLSWNGGNQAGIAIASVDPQGFVHADQFWWHYSLGNVRQRPFSQIWEDRSDPVLGFLKDRQPHLLGRCRVCPFLELCNGNLRVRAERYFGDLRAPDPACYLSDEELGIRPGTPEAREAARWPVPVQAPAT